MRILALFLILVGSVALYVGSHNLIIIIQALAFALFVASAYLVRKSRVRDRTQQSEAIMQGPDFKPAGGPGRLAWGLSLSMVPLLAISYFLMYEDALHGGKTGWPAFLFAGVIIACCIVWGYLVAQILNRR